MSPEFRLKLENKKKDTTKTTYRIQQAGISPHSKTVVWRMTLWRLEWFPRKRTWRLIETRGENLKGWSTFWKQYIHAEFGDIDEASACELAIPTALMCGLR